MKPRHRAACLLASAALCLGTPVFAQPADEATRTAARALGTSGVEAYQAGDYAMATDRLEKAYGILRVPSLGLWSARALVKVGKWMEAADRYLEVTSLQVPTGDYAVQKQAQAEAETEVTALKAKIPTISVRTEGAPLAETEVVIDGRPVTSALAGEGRLVNPGRHVIEGRRAGEQVRVELEVSEGQRETALLRFGSASAAAVPGVPAAPAAGTGSPVGPGEKASSGGSGTLRTLGFVALGAGVVGIGLGSVTGIMALGKKGQLDQNPDCVDDRCAKSQESNVDSYMTARTLSSVGFIAGGVLAGLGVVLLINSSGESRTQAWVSPNAAGLRGTF